MKKRFENDYMELLDHKNHIIKLREKPVTTKDLLDVQPLTVLSDLLNMWPTHDLRYDESISTEDPLLDDMMKSMELKITRTDIKTGIVEATVEFLSNLDQIERYNAAVGKHNEEWLDLGSPETVFDPRHGDIFPIKDTFVDPVYLQSSSYPLPKSVYSNKSTGDLAKARPSMKHKSYVRLKYQVRIIGDIFTLGYAAYDNRNLIIYYNEVSHRDLAYLVRRSVQEIWGNHTIFTQYSNKYLEGISMLLNGDKLSVCKEDNQFPKFLADEASSPKSTKPIRQMEEQEEILTHTSNLSAYWIPILTIIGFLICLGWTIRDVAQDNFQILMGDGISGGGIQSIFYLLVEVVIKPQMMGCILFLIITVMARKFAQDTERKASELKARRKFI